MFVLQYSQEETMAAWPVSDSLEETAAKTAAAAACISPGTSVSFVFSVSFLFPSQGLLHASLLVLHAESPL